MDGTIFFSVGEPSGDLHASNLIKQIHEIDPRLKFRGLGGSRMQAAGCAIDFDLTQLAVVGIVEVIPKLREFFRVADLAESIMKAEPPSAVVLVDFPGFNWHIAKRAHRLGIPVYYYLPPQLWAWGGWRIRKLRATVDRVLCNLPFEPTWYSQRGVQVEYVGHPFFDVVHSQQLDTEFIHQWKQHSGLQVAVLPGSRTREVDKIWPMQLETIRAMAKKYPSTRFLVAAYKEQHRLACQQLLNQDDHSIDIEFFVGKTSELIEVCDCVLMKSGSVSLEVMARAKPCVVSYHASRSLYVAGRLLTNLNSMTLPNMIAGETVMPEFLAVGSTGKATRQVTEALDRLLGDSEARQAQSAKLKQLADLYAKPGASHTAACHIVDWIRESNTK